MPKSPKPNPPPAAPFGPGPAPADVRYNDWRQVALPPPEQFAPRRPVSVVMPYYQTPAATLERTLAALEGQSYPPELFEVVIVDDGSEPPLVLPLNPTTDPTITNPANGKGGLQVRVVRQERRGFGVARARNTGVRAAAHDIILFLDSDSMPESGWLAAHARWHHYVSDVLTVGFRAHVIADDLSADTIRQRAGTLRELFPGRAPEPVPVDRHLYMLRTNDLTTRSDDLFQAVVGGNFGIGRDFYWQAGGHDESFNRYGREDNEFCYRVYNHGGLFAPVRNGFVWHQGPNPENDPEKRRNLWIQMGKAGHLIAHPLFRGVNSQQVYTVPRYVVTIDAGDCPAEQIIAVTENILADRTHDLIARIEVGDDDLERLAWLQDAFGPEPRVRLSPTRPALDEFPASPFHISLPATITGKNLVSRLRARLGSAVIATAPLPDTAPITIARTWALHRAHRNHAAPGDYGETRRITPTRLKLKPSAPTGNGTAARRPYPPGQPPGIRTIRRAWRRARRIWHRYP